MKPFFIENRTGKIVTYQQLLHDLSQPGTVTPHLPASGGTTVWILNFLRALLYHINIELTDTGNAAFPENNVLEVDGLQLENEEALQRLLLRSKSAIVLSTSGTTGQPKKIAHTIQQLTREVKRGPKFQSNTWALTFQPAHMAGLQVLFQALLNGNSLVDVYSNTQTELFSALDRYAITHISGTPTFYRTLLPASKQWKQVKRISFGGERSEQSLWNKLREVFPEARFTNIYASTEGGTLLTSRGTYFSIPPEKANEILVIEDELVIHRSLLGNIPPTSILETDWYYTGDLVEFSSDGSSFRFISRKNEMINTGGYKVNPEEVETILHSVGPVKEARVYGLPNSVLGTILVADIVAAEPGMFNETLLREEMEKYLPDYKIPRHYYLHEKLPLTGSGKLKRS